MNPADAKPDSFTPDSDAGSPARVLRRFRVVFNAVRTQFQQMERQVGLGGAQVWALSLVQAQPGIGMGGVARSMDIHQSTASNLVKSLLQRGLIRMEKAESDRRHVCLFVEPAGAALLAKVAGPFEGVLPQALARLPPSTLQRLDRDLKDLIELLHADQDAARIPLAQL